MRISDIIGNESICFKAPFNIITFFGGMKLTLFSGRIPHVIPPEIASLHVISINVSDNTVELEYIPYETEWMYGIESAIHSIDEDAIDFTHHSEEELIEECFDMLMYNYNNGLFDNALCIDYTDCVYEVAKDWEMLDEQ